MVALGPACHDTGVVTTNSFLGSVLSWLRAGYPDGVPGPDRVPLLALLRSTPLSEEQVREVVHTITAPGSPAVTDGVIEHDEIADFISDMTHYDAGPENIRRVAATLAAAGWPLSGIEISEPETSQA